MRRFAFLALALWGCGPAYAQDMGIGMGMAPQTGRGEGQEPRPVFDFNPEALPGGIDQLSQTLTVANGSSGTLLWRYEAADASGETLTATGAGVTLTLTGSGTDPALDTGAPTHGSGDTSVTFGGGAGNDYYTDGGGNTDLTTTDFAFEALIQAGPSGTGYSWMGSRTSAAGLAGWELLYNSGAVRFVLDAGAASVGLECAASSIAPGVWVHVAAYADRSGSGILYCDAAAGSAGSLATVTGTIASGADLQFGTSREGTSQLTDGAIAYAAMWTFADIGTHLQPTATAERFAKLNGTWHTSAAPSAFTRATTATTFKDIGSGSYQAFLVGTAWPRVAVHPSYGGPGYFCENTAENLLLQNYDLGTTWGVIDVGDTIGGSVADIFGAIRATLGIIGDSTDGQHGVDQAVTLTATTYTFSCYAEAGDQGWLYMANTTVANATHYCDLSATCANGTTGAGGTAIAVQDLGAKCRCAFSFTGTAAAHTFQVSPAAADGDNTFAGDGATVNTYVDHCQIETGAFPTSPIPTTTAAVTRNDDQSLTYTWPGTTEVGIVSLVADTLFMDGTTFNRMLLLNDGSADDEYKFQSNTSGGIRLKVNDGAATQANLDSSTTGLNGTRATHAGTARLNDVRVWVSGVDDGEDTTATMPSGMTTVLVGDDGGSGTLTGMIYRGRIYAEKQVTE